MPNYDFHQLSPYDLELLVRDLLQAHWNVRIESFKTGSDWGIDIRYARGDNKTVVQVKHFLRTGLRGLIRELKSEADKVRRLDATRYLVVTSVPLSPANKDAIIAAMQLSVLTSNDILGVEDLNNLLGQYPKIEQQHYKLWLASKAVLDRVLHNAEITRSDFKVRQVFDKVKKYVTSSAYPKALEMLAERGVVIISGPPGVGKTTLADLLLYEHVKNGFNAIEIQRDISEGERLFQLDQSQIFYFDDFMGATFRGDRGQASSGTSDRALLNFIAMVQASKGARLVMTTREHIYSQAVFSSERLRHSEIDDLRVMLNMPAYSKKQRAKILYNHVYFSDLPSEYRSELLRDDFFMRIVEHEKFNPRLIEWLSNFRKLNSVPASKYQGFIQDLLRDPSEIWQHAYEQEISDSGRSLLLTLYSFEGRAGGQHLHDSFWALHSYRARQYGYLTRPEDFGVAVREIANSFVKPSGPDGFEVIDPSILDLMNAVIEDHPNNGLDIISSAKSFVQIQSIWNIANQAHPNNILHAITASADHVSRRIATVMVAERVKHWRNVFDGPIYENRLRVILEMAERTGSAALYHLIYPMLDRLKQKWEAEWSDINSAVDLIRYLRNSVKRIAPKDVTILIAAIEARALNDATVRCRADELRELLSVIDTSTPDSEVVKKACQAFDAFRGRSFQEDLRQCKSSYQFTGLSSDLEFFRDTIGVDVAQLLVLVEDEKIEFEAHEDAYADYMHDEWKERSRDQRDQRDENHGLREMFGSLRGDTD